MFTAEAWVSGPKRLSRYLRPGELQTANNFDYLRAPWEAARLREVIDSSLDALGSVGAPATWELSNHDVVRHVPWYGRAHTVGRGPRADVTEPLGRARGARRARAAARL